MGQFVVAHILDNFKPGDRFTIWPLHITLLPPFEADDASKVEKMLTSVSRTTVPIELKLGEFTQFGQNTVRLVNFAPELNNLHKSLLSSAEEIGLDISSKWTGDRYVPHITRKKGIDYTGDKLLLDSLQMVESLPQGYRQIISDIKFGENGKN